MEWYTANPGYHEIPAGYGLPWGTPEEEYIPDALVYESQMALSRAQMATQSPNCDAGCQPLPSPPAPFAPDLSGDDSVSQRQQDPFAAHDFELAQATEEIPSGQLSLPAPAEESESDVDASSTEDIASGSIVASEPIDTTGTLPPNWPCEDCCVSATPPAVRPPCVPFHGPVLKHTRVYSGTDADFTQALESYVYFRNDKRFGGWESYLQRSDDFIRFCCHVHISEMLSARGGSRKTRVVWRWSANR